MSSIGDALLLDRDLSLWECPLWKKSKSKWVLLSITLFFDFYYTFIVFEVISNTK